MLRSLIRFAKQLLANKRLRIGLAVVILLLTAVVFVRFFAQHPQYLDALKHITLAAVLAIIALNVGVTISLVFVSNFLLELCGKKLPWKEQFLLTAYSSIANFFGPLQSGPGVRMVYLKTKHQVRVRDYTLASLINMAMFATISATMLFGISRPWWQALAIVLAVAGVSWSVIRFFMKRDKSRGDSQFHWSGHALLGLLIATAVQILFVTGYYFVELRVVSSHISLHQAIIYTGAANFGLFLSLTPDAIGIRESFLVLSKRLHRISTAIIFAANIIDRAVYALYLGLLFLLVLGVHGRDRFKVYRARQPAPPASPQ